MIAFRIRVLIASLAVMVTLASCNLPSIQFENEAATLPPSPIPAATAIPGLGSAPSAVPDISKTGNHDSVISMTDFLMVSRTDARIDELASRLTRQNKVLSQDLTETSYSNGVATSLYWFTSPSDISAVLILRNANQKSNSFIMDFSDKAVTMSDLEGRLEISTAKVAGQDVIHISIFEGDSRIYDSLETSSLESDGIVLCGARPQSLSGFWAWVKKCLGPRKYLANTLKCVAATTAVTVAYLKYKALEAKTRLDHVAFAAVTTTFLANCLSSANDCFFSELFDNPPECTLTGWVPSGKKTQIPWLNGRIQAVIHKAKISCSDDKSGCCTYNPPSDWVEAPSGAKGTVKITDSGGNQVTLEYQAPQPSDAELKTLISGVEAKTYIGQFSRSAPEVMTIWQSCNKGVKELTDTVQIYDNGTTTITGKASYAYQCNRTESSFTRSFEMTFNGTKKNQVSWSGNVSIIITQSNQNPSTVMKDWQADLKDNTLSLRIDYDRTTYQSWASGDLMLYKP